MSPSSMRVKVPNVIYGSETSYHILEVPKVPGNSIHSNKWHTSLINHCVACLSTLHSLDKYNPSMLFLEW